MDSPSSIATIGYQGKSIDTVLDELKEADIEVLCDVRRRPQSRKPGFSKKSLEQHLSSADIAYRHFPDLGMPNELLKLRSNSDNTGILLEYQVRLGEFNDLVATIGREASLKNICLMCFERDFLQCHRGVLAQRVTDFFDLEVRHL